MKPIHAYLLPSNPGAAPAHFLSLQNPEDMAACTSLEDMELLILSLSPQLLTRWEPAYEHALLYALKHHIPVLSLYVEPLLTQLHGYALHDWFTVSDLQTLSYWETQKEQYRTQGNRKQLAGALLQLVRPYLKDCRWAEAKAASVEALSLARAVCDEDSTLDTRRLLGQASCQLASVLQQNPKLTADLEQKLDCLSCYAKQAEAYLNEGCSQKPPVHPFRKEQEVRLKQEEQVRNLLDEGFRTLQKLEEETGSQEDGLLLAGACYLLSRSEKREHHFQQAKALLQKQVENMQQAAAQADCLLNQLALSVSYNRLYRYLLICGSSTSVVPCLEARLQLHRQLYEAYQLEGLRLTQAKICLNLAKAIPFSALPYLQEAVDILSSQTGFDAEILRKEAHKVLAYCQEESGMPMDIDSVLP